MSDEDDDTPPEALFFIKRAQSFPKASLAEVETVTKLLEEAKEEKTKIPEVKEKIPARKGRSKRPRKCVSPDIEEEILIDNQGEYEGNKTETESPSPALAPCVKRRLKTIHTRQANELKKIVAANKQVLSATTFEAYSEVEEIAPDPSEKFPDFILTLSYRSEISRLRCCKNEKFSTIFPKVANLFNLKPSELLLCLDNYNINLDDSPKSLRMSLTDTIECLPYKGSETVAKSDNVLKIFFQSEGSKEKVNLSVHKLEKMQDLMQRYSELRDIPVENIVFEFDGEKIDGTETPLELDMESGNCIDVKILAKSVNEQKGQTEIRDCTKETSPYVIDLSDDDGL